MTDTAEHELRALLGADVVLAGGASGYSSDETEGRDLTGRADAVVLPRSTRGGRARRGVVLRARRARSCRAAAGPDSRAARCRSTAAS